MQEGKTAWYALLTCVSPNTLHWS